MARRNQPFEQRYYFQETGKSDRTVQTLAANIGGGGDNKPKTSAVQVEHIV